MKISNQDLLDFYKELKGVFRHLVHLEDRVNSIVDNFALDCLDFERVCREKGVDLDADERLFDS